MWDAISAYGRLGVVHILTGFDHLAFLAALLLVARDRRDVILVVTSFTVAHSLTLALVTLRVITISSRLTEMVIAVSIIWVGVENLLAQGAPRNRWILTFVFGLVHGLGFAGVLEDLGVADSEHGVVLPLLAFNLGVEIGQLAVAALLVPLIWRISRRDDYATRWLPWLSGLIIAAGIAWLIQRATG